MNTKMITAGTLTGLIAAAGIATLVAAQSTNESALMTEQQIIEIAQSEIPGDVTEIELKERRGDQYYKVEILSAEGNEMKMKIDAENGEVMKVKEKGEDCKKGERRKDN